MVIGVPKEIKKYEYRVGMTPSGVAELVTEAHAVMVETGAGEGSGFSDDAYRHAGGGICSRDDCFAKSDLIVKVKEPLHAEYDLFREGQALFTYLHLAADAQLLRLLLDRQVTAIGYETLEKDGALPLLAPMSEIAGRMAPLMGNYFLQKFTGGAGVLACGATGVKPARALIIGAGVVGSNAARICAGLGMDTTVMNRGVERLQRLDDLFQGRVKTLAYHDQVLREEIREADLVVGAVLVPGGRTPLLVTRGMLGTMKRGCVLVDVSVDQGGCAETSRPTTHDDPVYEVDGVVHYAVANMPGAYPHTSTVALANATLPYIKKLARLGVEMALKEDGALAGAVNTCRGSVTHKGLAESAGFG